MTTCEAVAKRMDETGLMNSDRGEGRRRDAAALDLVSSGGRDARIELVAYDPSWPRQFAVEAARLIDLLPGLRWHHIGSTAVPGLLAKPIIDLMATTDDLDAPLSTLTGPGGYQYPEAYNAALHARRWLCRPSATRRTHHLHLVGDPNELKRNLRFCDALRRDVQLVAEYAALKSELAEEFFDDREAYTAGKTAFITRVVSTLDGNP